MRIVVTGGGTGGHTSPAVAIVEALRARSAGAAFLWIGKRGGIEERVSAAAGVPFRAVRAMGWPRGWTLRRALVPFQLLSGIVQSVLAIRAFRADAVIGVGGYVSLGPLIAALLLRVPVYVHEQNKRLGLANRIVARRAARLFLSFEGTIGVPRAARALVTGNPVRAGFVQPPTRAAARVALGFPAGTPLVLVVGGSQGAQSINAAVAAVAPLLDAGEAAVYWMTGAAGAAAAEAAARAARVPVRVAAFIDGMPAACAAADLIVCRAGASTTAELCAIGRPAILVPYPHATDNHQEHNARALEAAGAGEVLLDRDCTGERLAARIRALLAEPARLAAMGAAARGLARLDAAPRIAAVIAGE